MGVRSFRDAIGTEWTVWDVRPHGRDRRTGATRRSGHDRRLDPMRLGGARRAERRRVPDRRTTADRRLVPRPRAVLLPGLEHGWLCFEGGTERRRLAPIPPDWEACEPGALEGYCRRASVTRSSARGG